MSPECTCAMSVLTYDGPDPECPQHGICAYEGHPTKGTGSCYCGAVTPLTPAYPELPEIPTETSKTAWYVPTVADQTLASAKLPPAPQPAPGEYLTTEQMQEWLTGLGPKKVKQALTEIGLMAPVDTPLTSTDAAEDPATAPCRVFWNSHACDKPRIHVLPGHPAGPAHECGWAGLGGYVEPCSKVSADGSEAWGWHHQKEQWLPIGLPKLHGEDWPG